MRLKSSLPVVVLQIIRFPCNGLEEAQEASLVQWQRIGKAMLGLLKLVTKFNMIINIALPKIFASLC